MPSGPGSQAHWSLNLYFVTSGWGALGKLRHLFELQFPFVRNEENAQLCALIDRIRPSGRTGLQKENWIKRDED